MPPAPSVIPDLAKTGGVFTLRSKGPRRRPRGPHQRPLQEPAVACRRSVSAVPGARFHPMVLQPDPFGGADPVRANGAGPSPATMGEGARP